MKKTFKEYLKPADGQYSEGPMSIVLHQGILYKLDVLFAYAKDLPVTMLDVADLKWQANAVEDEARVKKADLACPILVHPQNGKYIVLDGNTRLHKAIKTGVKQLPAKIIFEDVLSFARMGSDSTVTFASNVTDQNAYITGGAKTIKPVTEAAEFDIQDWSQKYNSGAEMWMSANKVSQLEKLVKKGAKFKSVSTGDYKYDDERKKYEAKIKKLKAEGWKEFASEVNYDSAETILTK